MKRKKIDFVPYEQSKKNWELKTRPDCGPMESGWLWDWLVCITKKMPTKEYQIIIVIALLNMYKKTY